MASIYEPGPIEGTEWCNPLNHEDSERIIVEVNGTRRSTTWKPIPMKLLRGTLRRKMRYSDSPWHNSSSLIFRKPAVEKMKPILDEYGELLPLECPDAELWVYNPTVILDALDDKATQGSRFSDGRFMMVDKYVFHADVVRGVDVFKLVNRRASLTFVSDRFVDLWNASGLKGLKFDKLWTAP